MGKLVERLNFGRIKERGTMPHFLEFQLDSYEDFLQAKEAPNNRKDKGLESAFREIFPVESSNGDIKLEYVSYELHEAEPPLNDELECKKRGKTYSTSLKVRLRLINKKSGNEIQESLVYFGEVPMMTERGTFIINGAERVVVSQLHRSPGVSFNKEINIQTGKDLFSGKIIPYKGTWLEFETDKNDFLSIKIDRKKKVLATVFLKAIDFFNNNTEIKDYFLETKELDLASIFQKYKNKDELLSVIRTRFEGSFIKEDIYDDETGEVIAEADAVIDEALIEKMIEFKIEKVVYWEVKPEDKLLANTVLNDSTLTKEEAVTEVFKKLRPGDLVTVESARSLIRQMFFNPQRYDLEPVGRYKMNKRLKLNVPEDEILLTKDDIIGTMKYVINLNNGNGHTDDIDNLSNRRVRGVGELLLMQIKAGLSKMGKMVKEKMTVQDSETLTSQSLLNTRPLNALILDFFGSGQLSQFMDQSNPLAELTHKRRISALGPGGLSRERAGFEVRDVHDSHYGRICPIETPEGPNIGLIGSLAIYAKINKYGFIETPYVKVVDGKADFDQIDYLAADEEEGLFIAQADTKIGEDGSLLGDVVCRFGHEIVSISGEKVDYLDISPKQVVSVSAGLIPFLEHDDANRALMGSNMQRQAVPLLRTEAPYIGTGLERKVAVDSGAVVISKTDGKVVYVDAQKIIIEDPEGKEHKYRLLNFERSNQSMCLHQTPLVSPGEEVKAGGVIADGPATKGGDLALGRNILMAFMPWEGYNYEDAILISDRLRKDDVFTSIHVEEYEIEARNTKLGDEEITREIPNISEEALRKLDSKGIITIGSEVGPGDILVGKTAPKGETEPPAEEKLLRAIFGEKARDVRDTSLRMPHGSKGTVVEILELSRENGDELKAGVNKAIRVLVAEKRKITVGDKMSGRHGNKGVVSRVLPAEDMPFLADGTHLDVVLNPLGVPSRMNIGQVLEVHLGMAMGNYNGGTHIATPVFDGASEEQVKDYLEKLGFPRSGKVDLYDGRTGEKFDNPVTVGRMYMLKLHHLVEDKMHARAIGPYSLVTQQPLGGKAQFGGQRLGEMEVWALEAYGASNILQEMLTVKSDDVTGRTKTYEAIIKGEEMPEPDLPESFKVLLKEFQALALDVELFDKDDNVINVDEELNKEDMTTEYSPLAEFKD
ncbi:MULTISPECIES: DNA-directed RNA polymerase subunit beta [Fusobacterium]|jgi:DNA-directed RNA polymerase subunit beta|uniref:DNA-directed RNA polymerase subunit beta n=1 Tax=Fusobacterium varium ATCC 27725 TaxID=469618 RepID=A0ABN5JEF9_FUSVA|nr:MULTISPECIES: DNA-directed RNA polymerase subunit beta [Fusobacterium]AVQ30434.1 DNA-directed RNA polymerase subunit beta [Fusobacterium varium ATCC 27725]EES64527.1 DNA-directed RNA polymerase, beta subunit [Fusobacterium varium ATCC 27725]MCF0168974.1 DNA-directed RNA polymerase subunit beta [Fusobacterium varium]MCF2673482.1 DNA-directed RNA polymerase subunit beta [Fusobacterium varium]OFL88253.1 DNA-directed RNA polymerase subunit beta [Fusobacterium sp. HMSC073F01]